MTLKHFAKKNDKLENELNQLKEQLSKLSTRLSAKRTSFPDVPMIIGRKKQLKHYTVMMC